MPLDPYAQLGITNDASAEEIRKAWKRKVQHMHPDKHPDDPFAAARFDQIRESYDILSDPARKSAYDAEGRTERDDLPERAQACLETAAVQLLEQAQASGHMGEINLVVSLRYALGEMKGQQERGRILAERDIRGLRKQHERLRRKGKGENLLGQLLSIRIDDTVELKRRCELAAEECAAALAMLDDYEDLDLTQLTLPKNLRTLIL